VSSAQAQSRLELRVVDYVVWPGGGPPPRESTKRGSVADLVCDIPYLVVAGFIPPRHIVNQRLATGSLDTGQSGGASWPPLTLSQAEFEEVVEQSVIVADVVAVLQAPVGWSARMSGRPRFPLGWDRALCGKEARRHVGTLANEYPALYQAPTSAAGQPLSLGCLWPDRQTKRGSIWRISDLPMRISGERGMGPPITEELIEPGGGGGHDILITCAGVHPAHPLMLVDEEEIPRGGPSQKSRPTAEQPTPFGEQLRATMSPMKH
jgi:hypothetical protein